MALGVLSKMSIAGTAMEFASESVARNEQLLAPNGMVGSRSDPSERTRVGPSSFGGSITLQPSHADLVTLLPYIVGAGSVLTETVADFTTIIERGTRIFTYTGCKIASAQFSASVGGFLQLSLQLQALDETVAEGTVSGTPGTGIPYLLSDLTLTIASTTYRVNQFSFGLDNGIQAEYFNSLKPIRLNETGRQCQWSLSTPYADGTALYGLSVGGVAVSAAFSNGTNSMTIASTKVQFPRQSPTNQGRGEIFLPLQGVARKDGSTAEVIFTMA